MDILNKALQGHHHGYDSVRRKDTAFTDLLVVNAPNRLGNTCRPLPRGRFIGVPVRERFVLNVMFSDNPCLTSYNGDPGIDIYAKLRRCNARLSMNADLEKVNCRVEVFV